MFIVVPANTFVFRVIDQQMLIYEICSQNYGFTQPLYYSERVSDLLTENGHRQVEDSLHSELTSSGPETLIKAMARLLIRMLLNLNLPKFYF